MNRTVGWLRNCLRQIVAVFLITVTFLAVPAFGCGELFQAQAETLIADAAPILDQDAAERVIESAEDRVGDRPIGDTGLKNIKKLGENIPQTTKLITRQRTGVDKPGTRSAKETSGQLKAESRD